MLASTAVCDGAQESPSSHKEASGLGVSMRSRRRGWGQVRHRIEVEPPDSLSARVQRVRERLRGSQCDRRVRSAIEVITSLAARVEPWQDDQEIHPAMQRQQWSALNIPLLWAVAEGDRHCHVLLWLVQACHQVESITVTGVPMAGREAVMVAWDAVSNLMRCWGVHTREDLSEWVHRQGFPRPW